MNYDLALVVYAWIIVNMFERRPGNFCNEVLRAGVARIVGNQNDIDTFAALLKSYYFNVSNCSCRDSSIQHDLHSLYLRQHDC